MLCDFPGSAKGTLCKVCRVPLERDYPAPPKRQCAARLLGDRVEHVFRSIGITEDRWTEARRAVGLWPNSKGCGCKARKEFLNRAHAWWLRNQPR